eukprot:CAMPEP_0179435640 /NCGR_PEP_ID=MMETSP0799-20121207/19720_1 /TAXON_ID=46947 /ORGANISM="Geminigera cryophila, Strain CCMP2564" /LENGTH=31 /DNA_ID= /DNA_START= /DNA_END= /DNA_ORIENTATION=
MLALPAADSCMVVNDPAALASSSQASTPLVR